MKLLLLGPLEATIRNQVVAVGRRQERALLGILALRPDRFVSVDRLADLLWDGSPPDNARAAIQTMVSHLRSALRAAGESESRILSRSGEYALHVDRDDIDVHRFRALVERATTGTNANSRAARFRQALSLWHGVAMSDSLDDAARSLLFSDVEELRVAAAEELLQARLELGEHAAAVAELQILIIEYPLRERPVGLLMTALYRNGRSTEALEAYAAFERRLADEHGVSPTDALRQLQLAVLRDDPAMGALPVAAEPSGSQPAQLPAGPTPFVGREEQLSGLEPLLQDGGLSAISIVSGPASVTPRRPAPDWPPLLSCVAATTTSSARPEPATSPACGIGC